MAPGTVETAVAWYSIALGALVFAMWSVSLARGRVPELATEPWKIRFHIAAEGLMALTLVAGGIGWLAGAGAAPSVALFGFGAAVYSIVNSSGYYAHRREAAPLVMFAVLLVTTVIAAVLTVSFVL